MNRKLIVVTGGYGFIGSRFVRDVIHNTPHNVVIIDKNTYAADKGRITSWFDPKKHMGRVTHYIADIASGPNTLCESTDHVLSKASYVVNFAAESHVDNSIADGSPFVRSNIKGVFNLLEICRHNEHLEKFIQISTDEVYGDMEDYRQNEFGSHEGFKLRGSSYYSASKASADLLVEACGRTYGLPYLITRTCNNYGPDQHPEKFLPKLIDRVNRLEPVPLYTPGTQVREWIHVDDNASCIRKLMLSDKKNDVFNIGSGELHTNKEIVEMVGDIVGKEVSFELVPDRLGHDKKYQLDSSKYKSFDKEFSPQCTLRDFLTEEIDELYEMSKLLDEVS